MDAQGIEPWTSYTFAHRLPASGCKACALPLRYAPLTSARESCLWKSEVKLGLVTLELLWEPSKRHLRVMAFVNNYTPEQEILESELYGPEPYDINFVLPVPPSLSTSKLHLVPFIPRIHVSTYLDCVRGHESMFKYIPIALEHPSDFLRFLESRRRDKTAVMFAAIDRTRPDPNHPDWEGSLAGLFGLAETDKTMLVIEIDPAIVLPAFQRTHVSSHAVGLLLKYILELPPSGVGFRRANWTVSPINVASNNLAKRMGFKLEGVFRWKYIVPAVEGYHKLGKEARAGDAGSGLLGIDSNELALCWDDWEESARELVERAFAREA